ncbi:MAG: hypothetical protein JNL28_06210 [Planctomycetes bacterium]|nr:hypothetical protein [Planctomycetota bacterium]
MIQRLSNHKSSKRGTTLTLMMLVMIGLFGISAAAVVVSRSHFQAGKAEREKLHARYVSQAGIAHGMFELRRGNSGAVGSYQNPAPLGEARYWVTAAAVGTNMVTLTATGTDDRRGARTELTVRSVPNTVWRFGAFGREFLNMDSNARVDSYNSDAGTYATQAINGSGSSAYASANGHVGSNGNILMKQNSKVWGNATAGPSHTTTVLGNAVVTGSTSPATQELLMPTLSVPSYTSYGALTVSAATTIPAGNRTYSNLVVNANKTLTINGPASIVMTNLTLKSGSKITINPTNGPVELWVIDNFVMNSNSQIAATDFKPKNVRLNLMSDNVINPEVNVQVDSVEFESNSQLYGTILAPTAAITINSNFELFGSILARRIDLNSNARFHFDEALISATGSGTPTFETVCWRELPYKP